MSPALWHPAETRDVKWEDELGTYVGDGEAWFLNDGEWQTRSPESWAWQFQRSGYGMRVWVPQVRQFEPNVPAC